MKMLRYRLGRFVIHLGLRILPPSRTRSELFGVIDVWASGVRDTVSAARIEGRTK